MNTGGAADAGARLRDLFPAPPKELGFGTSGLRGLVTEITDLEAWINTRGFLSYLFTRSPSSGGIRPGARVALAGDLRPSTHGRDRSILRSVARAVKDSGCEVEFCGLIPTPALTLHGLANGIATIMVTGSHIPFNRNGIKFNRADGEVLKEDEAGILDAVRAARAVEYDRESGASIFQPDGFFKPGAAPEMPPVARDAEAAYVARYQDVFPASTLAGLRVLFYQHSAVGQDIAPRILEALGAEVIRAGRSETFIPIDTEDVSDGTLHELERLARECAGAKSFDAIISTDGDSDRPLVCGLSGKGAPVFVGGDLLGLVTAEFIRADAVVVPISANDAVEERLRERDVPLIQTRIGSPYVIRALHELRARRPDRSRVVGWEANGGFLLGTSLELDGRRLVALPTRDAVLPIIAALATAKQSGVRIEEVFARFPRRFGRSGIVDNFPPDLAASILKAIAPPDPEIEELSREADGIAVRTSSEERRPPTRRNEIARALEAYFARVSSLMRDLLAFDRVTKVNMTDGVRLRSAAGDVVHFRPSGNAPQFRVYACAGSPERARAIVADSIREPDGAVRRLAVRFTS
jgi:phosphomannomutase